MYSSNAVTWGAFPGSEIIQPTVVDPVAFHFWKVRRKKSILTLLDLKEAFGCLTLEVLVSAVT